MPLIQALNSGCLVLSDHFHQLTCFCCFVRDAAELRDTFAESGVKALGEYGNGLAKLLTGHHVKAMQQLSEDSVSFLDGKRTGLF
jgi:hypothetical protein